MKRSHLLFIVPFLMISCKLDYLFGGYNYRLPPPGAVIKEGKLYANVDFPGLAIRYTTDRSEPDATSPVYTGPVKIEGEVLLRSFDTQGQGQPGISGGIATGINPVKNTYL